MNNKITYDGLLEKIPNKYILTIVAGKRARMLMKEATATTNYKKTTLINKVFKEIIEEKLEYENE